MALGIVVVDALVNLPEIEMVGPQAPQRFVELAHRDLGVASVRADLGHQEHRVPAILDRASHSPLALAVVILPGVVEEVDAGVDRFVNDPNRLGDGPGFAEVIAAESEDGHQVAMPAKQSALDRAVAGRRRRHMIEPRVATGIVRGRSAVCKVHAECRWQLRQTSDHCQSIFPETVTMTIEDTAHEHHPVGASGLAGSGLSGTWVDPALSTAGNAGRDVVDCRGHSGFSSAWPKCWRGSASPCQVSRASCPGWFPVRPPGLMVVMISATIFHIARDEVSSAIVTAVLFVMATFVAYQRWKVMPILPRPIA